MRLAAADLKFLVRAQIFPSDISTTFHFFSDPRNLQLITPNWLKFRTLEPLPTKILDGAIMEHQLLLHGIPIRWQTEIRNWNPPFGFTDIQRKGPFNYWAHQHLFETIAKKTLMVDIVCYQVPFGRLKGLIDYFYVRHALNKIFIFRRNVIAELLRVSEG